MFSFKLLRRFLLLVYLQVLIDIAKAFHSMLAGIFCKDHAKLPVHWEVLGVFFRHAMLGIDSVHVLIGQLAVLTYRLGTLFIVWILRVLFRTLTPPSYKRVDTGNDSPVDKAAASLRCLCKSNIALLHN